MNSYWLKKLVRDKSVERMEEEGALVFSKTLNGQEFISELNKKFSEEIEELSLSKTLPEQISELADILELVDAYRETLGVTKLDLEKYQADKRESRGSFSKKTYVEYIDTPKESHFDKYCAAERLKYPPRKK